MNALRTRPILLLHYVLVNWFQTFTAYEALSVEKMKRNFSAYRNLKLNHTNKFNIMN